MSSIRSEKIASMLKRELSTIFQQNTQALFSGLMITVTQVRVTPDLSLARVYLSIFPPEKKDSGMETIEAKSHQIKRLFAAEVGKQLRKVPELQFFIDDSLDYMEEIERLLK